MTTLAEAQARLDEYMAAESRILQAQEVRLGGPGIDRWERQTELKQVREGIAQWQSVVNRLTAAASGKPTFSGMTFTSARFN